MRKYQKSTTIAAVGACAIAATYMLNKLIFLNSNHKDLLYSKNSHIYSWRFGKIFYTRQGVGPALLLIHDLNHTSSDLEFRCLVDRLSKNYCVYTIDLLGCGRSDKPKLTYTSYLYVQLINDFIKQVIGTKTHIIATSGSASLAVMACYSDSSLYGNLMLINPENMALLNRIPTRRHRLLKYLLELPILGTLTYNLVNSKQNIYKQFVRNYYYHSSHIKGKLVDIYYEAAHKGGSSSKYLFSSIRCHYTNTNITHAVKSINNSIYLLFGEQERDMADTMLQYQSCNPAIECSVISRTNHLPQIERADEVISLCEMFF